jgi:hypothetical protein
VTNRAEDWLAIHVAQKRLREAKRALRSALLKRDRRAARVDAALDAFQKSARVVEAAQADVQTAQRDNDQAFLRAAQRALREGS